MRTTVGKKRLLSELSSFADVHFDVYQYLTLGETCDEEGVPLHECDRRMLRRYEYLEALAKQCADPHIAQILSYAKKACRLYGGVWISPILIECATWSLLPVIRRIYSASEEHAILRRQRLMGSSLNSLAQLTTASAADDDMLVHYIRHRAICVLVVSKALRYGDIHDAMRRMLKQSPIPAHDFLLAFKQKLELLQDALSRETTSSAAVHLDLNKRIIRILSTKTDFKITPHQMKVFNCLYRSGKRYGDTFSWPRVRKKSGIPANTSRFPLEFFRTQRDKGLDGKLLFMLAKGDDTYTILYQVISGAD